jgi:DNA-binding NarL/FixJ family response regulator
MSEASISTSEAFVLERVLAGASNEAIARERGTSKRTVEKQVASLLRKVGVRSRRELFALVAGDKKDLELPDLSLTARERQVAALAALGHANKVIAFELGIAQSTVAVLLSRAAHKLGAPTRAELARIIFSASGGRRDHGRA